MKSKRLNDSIGFIDSDLVEGAVKYDKKAKNNSFVKIASLCACFLLVATVGIVALLNKPTESIDSGNDTASIEGNKDAEKQPANPTETKSWFDELSFSSVSEAMVLNSDCYVKTASASGDIYLPQNCEVTLIGATSEPDVNGDKWGHISFMLEGKQLDGYVKIEKLSKIQIKEDIKPIDTELKFNDKNDKVRVAVDGLILRTSPDNNKTSISRVVVTKGTTLDRKGVADKEDKNGIVWSKIEYEGKIYYVDNASIEVGTPLYPQPQPNKDVI